MRETTKHRLAFNIYVNLGPHRTLEQLEAVIRADPKGHGFSRPPSLRSLYRWSSDLHWQHRLVDLEREARRRDAETLLQNLREMNERQAREGLMLQQKAVLRLQALDEAELTSSEAVRALTEGARLERLACGEVTERTMQERGGEIDLSGFSIAELRALAEAAGSRAGRNRPEEPGQSAGLDRGVSED